MTLEDPIVALSRELIERGSKSFAAAARLLPDDLRASAYMLYAWCRYCDDVIDGQELGFRSATSSGRPVDARTALALVGELRERTRAACRGSPDGPIFEALSRVVSKHGIPERYPIDLIEGFAMDARGIACRTLDDTLLYSYHVAGVVGLMMAQIMGAKDRDVLNRACDLGIAFQLTNIARDVTEDAQAERIYLPLDWLASAGVQAHRIAAPENRQAVSGVTNRVLDEADLYYVSAMHGIAALPFRAGSAIAAARSIYRAIGTEVRARGGRAWDERIAISKPRKVAMLVAAPATVVYAKLGAVLAATPRSGLWTHPDLAG